MNRDRFFFFFCKPPPVLGRTNIVSYSHDLTQASWGFTGPAAIYGATGLDGGATASTITDDNTASSPLWVQDISVSTIDNPITLRFWVKEDPAPVGNARIALAFGLNTYEEIDLSINLSTGAILEDVGYNPPPATYEANLVTLGGANWWEILISTSTSDLTNNTIEIIISPTSYTLDTTTSDHTLTGSAIIGNAEVYQNQTIADIRGTDPIYTES